MANNRGMKDAHSEAHALANRGARQVVLLSRDYWAMRRKAVDLSLKLSEFYLLTSAVLAVIGVAAVSRGDVGESLAIFALCALGGWLGFGYHRDAKDLYEGVDEAIAQWNAIEVPE